MYNKENFEMSYREYLLTEKSEKDTKGYDTIQQVRVKLTDISSTLSRLSSSKDPSIKKKAKELEKKIDIIRTDIFDFNV